jgi:hypothetical protein
LAASCRVAPAATDFVWLETVMELSVLVEPVLCVFDLLLPPPQPERTRQVIKIEPNNAPIFFMMQTSSLSDSLRIQLRIPAEASPDVPCGNQVRIAICRLCHPTTLYRRFNFLVRAGIAAQLLEAEGEPVARPPSFRNDSQCGRLS